MATKQEMTVGETTLNLRVVPTDATEARALVHSLAAFVKAEDGKLTVVAAYATHVAVSAGLVGAAKPYPSFQDLADEMGTSKTTVQKWARLGRAMVVAGVKPGTPLWNALANKSAILDGGMAEVLAAPDVSVKSLTEAVIERRKSLKGDKPKAVKGPAAPGTTSVPPPVPADVTDPTARVAHVLASLDAELKGRNWTGEQLALFGQEVKRIMNRETQLLKQREAAEAEAAATLAATEAAAVAVSAESVA